MRILLIHQYFLEKNDTGGSRWNEMVRFWESEGHSITVLAGMIHGHKSKKYEKYVGKYIFTENYSENVKVIRSHVSETYNLNFIGRLWAYFSFVFSSLIASFLKLRGKYDIIIVTSPPLFVGITALIISKLKGIPYLFEIRDLWPESAIDTGVLKNKFIIKLSYYFEKILYKNAILINALTPAFKRVLIDKKGISEKKIIEISNAADFAISENILASFDEKEFKRKLDLEDKFVVTYVGAHGKANHLDQILYTAKILEDSNVYFLLIGDGMLRESLIVKSDELCLKNVRFIKSVPKEDVFKYILASDMGTSVLAKNDTFKTVFSNKTFDYMSCKKPILMAIDGISRELVENANAGIFVEPENPEDFAKKILLYINNPKLAKEQGENGYIFAKEHFDREKLAKNYIEFIKNVL